jgi:hypothetical protein
VWVGLTYAKIRYSRFCSLMTRKEVQELDKFNAVRSANYTMKDVRSDTTASTLARTRTHSLSLSLSLLHTHEGSIGML